MNDQLRVIILILLAIAAVAYLGGVAWAGIASLQTDEVPEIPAIVTQAITVIGGVLATHTGAVFGIARYLSSNTRLKPKVYNPVAWSVVPKREGVAPGMGLDMIQITAVVVYLVSLLAAVVFWGLDGFADTSAEVLRNMSYTFVGLIGGLLAVQLNVDNAR